MRRAFTLLEVIVALAIFALSAIVLASAYVGVLNGYAIVARSAQSNEDLSFARSLILAEADRTKVEAGGDFDSVAGRHVKWSAVITSTATADLFSVAFTCELSDSAKPAPEIKTETFLLLRPTWSIDTAERDKLRESAKTRIAEIQGKKS